MKSFRAVEFHRHERNKPVYFFDDVVSLQWSSSISPPHGQAVIVLTLPLNQFDLVLPGDWVVVRDNTGRTVFLGRTMNTNDGINVADNGAIISQLVTVQVESWLDFLNRVQIFAPDGDLGESSGTLFTIPDWSKITESILTEQVGGKLGQALERLFQALALVKLPTSLGGGGLLKDVISVVYDDDSRAHYAPDMVVESLPNVGMFPTHLGFQTVRSTVYQMLRSIFVPEPNLIELFAHLSPRDEDLPRASESGPSEVDVTRPVTQGPLRVDLTIAQGSPPGTGRSDIRETDTTADFLVNAAPETPSRKGNNSLVEYLKARPVLIYRVKPWRTKPLYRSIFSAVNDTRRGEAGYLSSEYLVDVKNPQDPLAGDWGQQQILEGIFNTVTWDKSYFTIVPKNRTVALARTRTDDARMNCSFADLSIIGEVEALRQSGLPIRLEEEIWRHGLRVGNVTWPFVITPGDPTRINNFIMYLRSIAVQMMQFYHRGHVFGSGTVNIAGAERLANFDYIPGPRNRTADYPKGEPAEFGDKFIWPLQAGHPFGIPISNKPFAAYAESVFTSIDVRDTKIVGNIQITYSRGLFGEDEDPMRDGLIPLKGVDQLLPTSKSWATTKDLGDRQIDPFTTCTMGRPTESNWQWDTDPRENGIPVGPMPRSVTAERHDIFRKPNWLKLWALSRIPEGGLRSTMQGIFEANPELDRLIVNNPDNAGETFTPSYKASDLVWFVAAAMYVIERYWQLKYPTAQIAISSWYRPADTDKQHTTGTAIDFRIEYSASDNITQETLKTLAQDPVAKRTFDLTSSGIKLRVPALQTYASLVLLSKARRIPSGGRGLYLNFGPTGMKGLKPEDAGESSSGVGKQGGPGGSGAIHYDLRGAFGVEDWKHRYIPNYWAFADLDGDGKDETDGTLDTLISKGPWVDRDGNPMTDAQAAVSGSDAVRLGTKIRDYVIALQSNDARYDAWASKYVINREDAAYMQRTTTDKYFPPLFQTAITVFGGPVATVAPGVTVPNGQAIPAGDRTQSSGIEVTEPSYGTLSKSIVLLPSGERQATSGNSLFMIFGGVPVYGEESGTYMLDYVLPLIPYNDVFIAKNNQVNGTQSYDWVLQNVEGTSRTKVLYMFSGGQLPCQSLISRFNEFNKIYLVDPYFNTSFSLFYPIIQANPSKFVFIYTKDYYQNGMDSAKIAVILATGVENQLLPGTGLTAHLATNETAVRHILAGNFVALDDVTAGIRSRPHQEKLVVHTGARIPNILQVLGYESSCFWEPEDEFREPLVTPTTPQISNTFKVTYDYQYTRTLADAIGNPIAASLGLGNVPVSNDGASGAKTVTLNFPYGPLENPTRAGYAFGGWYTSVGGTGTEVTPDTVVTIASDHKIYAKWAQVTAGVDPIPEAQPSQTSSSAVSVTAPVPGIRRPGLL
jgi:uncharacterized repeat protein (TIGR02543 family)